MIWNRTIKVPATETKSDLVVAKSWSVRWMARQSYGNGLYTEKQAEFFTNESDVAAFVKALKDAHALLRNKDDIQIEIKETESV